MADAKTITFEGVRILFRNFEGREDRYNRQGDRNFSVVLDPDLAAQLAADKWNVKVLEAREEGDEVTYILPVAVSYKVRPPRVVMLTESGGRTNLDEDSVEMLDWAYIKNVDLIVRGRDWENNGKAGVKAYLQSLYVTIEEDELERKYAVHRED